ncbi:MAG TPA: anthranilate phosphoribosyltransferase [Nitrosopumilaceae archaeon]|nr:anthranilate phosphoribosyltransferase [Nitrosopumilaceae archaeon]
MIAELTNKLSLYQDLNYDEMGGIMDELFKGQISSEEAANFLRNLTEKGESDEELLAMLDKMQQYAIHISPKRLGRIIDVCGTGGDKMKTFNVSTTAAFVINGVGGTVAKHGNRSVSGISGSADIFEYFGYDLNMSPERVTEIIEKCGIGFMFAQKFHPAMKNIAEARKILGIRTAFNLLGPLSNPAQVKNQLVGVFSADYLERIVLLLKARGAENVMSVLSNDGLDELSTTSKNQICHLKDGKISIRVLNPQDFGLSKSNLSDIQVSSKDEAIKSFITVLKGTANKSMTEITALNAAAGLIISDIANDFHDAIPMALDSIKSGKSYNSFKEFIRFCGNIEKIEEFEKL